MSSVPAGRFKPDRAGFAEMLNMGGVQQACLAVARDVASASGVEGVSCDVQAGKMRCHARASWSVPDRPRPRSYYADLWHGESATAALQQAAVSVGGQSAGPATALSAKRDGSGYNTYKSGRVKAKRRRKKK